MKDFHLSHLDQTMLRIYARHLLFFEFLDPVHLEDAIDALRAGFAATIRQLPFLAGNIRLSSPDTGRLSLEHPESPSDELIAQIFTFSHGEAGNPTFNYVDLEKSGFPPQPIWRDAFCPSLLRKHPGLDDEFAAGLISFKKGLPVPVFAAYATFIRGGLVLSVYANHSAIDGGGLTNVYKMLSEQTRSKASNTMSSSVANRLTDLDSQRRFFDTLAESSLSTDCPEIRHPGTPRRAPLLRNEPYKLASKIFIFPAATISSLASTLTFTTHRPISRFVALLSLLWTAITRSRAAILSAHNISTVNLGIAFDHRRNLPEPLNTTNYWGTCVSEITACAPVPKMLSFTPGDTPATADLAPTASLLADRLASITLAWLQPRLRLFSRTPHPYQLRSDSDAANGPDLFVTSWMHIGTDCAWGIPGTKGGGPAAVRKPVAHVEGLVHVLPAVRPEIVEVMVCLEEGEMGRVVRGLEGAEWDVRVVDA